MFCSNCGAKVSGNFCAQCGTRVVGAAGVAAPADAAASGAAPADTSAALDWSTECRYQTLIAHPAVRDLLTRYASKATKGVSAEDALGIAEKILPLFVATSPVAGAKLGAALVPVFARLGIRTGKERSLEVSRPAGTVIVAALCSLASHGQALGAVKQMEDGCLLEATLPSDILSSAGTIYVGVHAAAPATTHVTLATQIPGQAFDWGKSNRLLDTLAADLREIVD